MAQVTVVSDDTNVWVNHKTTSYDQNGPNGGLSEVRGMKKMQSMFAMLQSVTLRYADESSGPGRIVSVHAPSQLLPRANWSTIHNRMTRWSLYCSGGSAEPFGATTLWDMFKTIPLKLVVHCWGLSSLPQPLLLSFLLFCNPLALGKKSS